MARLGAVLGGLLTDVLRARLAADALTAEALVAYRDDPVLASMTVPRVAISHLTVRLRFVVSDVAIPEPSPLDVRAAEVEWNRAVRDRLLPRLLPAAPEAAEPEVGRLRDALAGQPVTLEREALESALGGDPDPVVRLTVTAILERVRTLSLDDR